VSLKVESSVIINDTFKSRTAGAEDGKSMIMSNISFVLSNMRVREANDHKLQFVLPDRAECLINEILELRMNSPFVVYQVVSLHDRHDRC
jgi:hypothetical protein